MKRRKSNLEPLDTTKPRADYYDGSWKLKAMKRAARWIKNNKDKDFLVDAPSHIKEKINATLDIK